MAPPGRDRSNQALTLARERSGRLGLRRWRCNLVAECHPTGSEPAPQAPMVIDRVPTQPKRDLNCIEVNAKGPIVRCFPNFAVRLRSFPVPPSSSRFRARPAKSGNEMAPEWRWAHSRRSPPPARCYCPCLSLPLVEVAPDQPPSVPDGARPARVGLGKVPGACAVGEIHVHGAARCGCVIRARLLARSETTLPRRRRPRWLARRAHRPVRDVRR